MPDNLQQKIVLTAFFDTKIITGSLLPYAILMNASNPALFNQDRSATCIIEPKREKMFYEPDFHYNKPVFVK
jgi:hypothetical protein